MTPRAIRHRTLGLCACGGERKPGCVSCLVCLDRLRVRTAKRVALGVCVGCDNPSNGRYHCTECQDMRTLKEAA